MTSALDGFIPDAREQMRFFQQRGIPVYASLLEEVVALLDQDAGLRERLATAWRERRFAASFDRPLLLCAALRQDALNDPQHALAPMLGERSTGKDAVPREALAAALASGAPAFTTLRTRTIQTNESTRAIAWRLALTAAWQPPWQVCLVDLGCSAGLNLVADRLPLTWTDEQGNPIALCSTAHIAARQGLDRNPVDVRTPAGLTWLRACVWPGQQDRLERLQQAAALATQALEAGEMALHTVDAPDMPAWLERHARAHPHARILALQTIMMDYLPDEARRSYMASMRSWLWSHAGQAMWVEFERGTSTTPGPVEIRAHLVLNGVLHTVVLGTTDFHPNVVRVDKQGMATLTAWAKAV